MIWFYLLQHRGLGSTDVHCITASCSEFATRWRVDRAWHLALELDTLTGCFHIRVCCRDCRNQRLGVWMQRSVVQVVVAGKLYHEPRYITPTRSEMCLTIDRSCEMNR